MKRFRAYATTAFLSLCWLGAAFAQTAPVKMRDANLATNPNNNFISTLNVFTAPRTLTLPAPSSVNILPIQFVDTANAVNSANTLSIQASDGSLINGQASITINVAGAYIFIVPSPSGYSATIIQTTSGTPPGGTSGQIQYNNAGAFGGFTTSGDATINTGTGALTLATVLGTPGTFGSATSCIVTTQNAKGLTTAMSVVTCTPALGSITGLGPGIAAALAINTGTTGAPVLFNGTGGTPTSLVLTNATGLPIGTGVSGLGTGVATALALAPNTAGGFTTQPVANASLATMAALSVKGNATNATAAPTDISTTSASNLPLRENGSGVLSFGPLNGGFALNNASVSLAKIANGTANSIVGATSAAAHVDLTVPSCSTASSVLQWLAGTGPQCLSFASTNLSDTTAATTWIPTDISGAGLVFTSVTGNFAKSNKTCTGNFRLTFPTTASGSSVLISSPCITANNGNPAMGTCFSTALAPNAIFVILGVANTAQFQLVNQTGGAAQPTNVNLSTFILTCAFSFITT